MNVSPINNTNFKGRFQKTPELEKIMKIADRNSLGMFNEVIERASKVNDGLIFKIQEFPSTCARKTFCLYKENTFKNISTMITGITTKINDSIGNGAKESELLGRFLPILEKIYPKQFKIPRENLIADIEKNLI